MIINPPVHSSSTADATPINQPLWPGDTGQLPFGQRRVLVRLLQGPSVSQAKTPELWRELCAAPATIASRLADLCLELIMDEEAQVAFARNAPPTEAPLPGPVPKVMRKVSLNQWQTALLLYLRTLLLNAEAQQTQALVETSEMRDHLTQYRRLGDTDDSKWEKHLDQAIQKMKDYSILDQIDAERWRISAVLRLILTPDQVGPITAQYEALRAEATGTPGGADETETDSDSPTLEASND